MTMTEMARSFIVTVHRSIHGRSNQAPLTISVSFPKK
jgi:hypothetical protein